jgi:membrane associated rhomboid family serine protease
MEEIQLNLVLLLTVVTVGISMYAWSNEEFMDAWIMQPSAINDDSRQWYRFLTSGFLHADWAHLIFNMIAFYSFGQIVLTLFEARFGFVGGNAAFLLLYLGGIVMSDVPTYRRHRHDWGYRSLGASGGVSSIIFAAVLYFPTVGIGFPLLPDLSIPGFLWAVLYLAYSHQMSRRGGDNINHDAHFYGALFGLVLALALIPSSLPLFFLQIKTYIESKL